MGHVYFGHMDDTYLMFKRDGQHAEHCWFSLTAQWQLCTLRCTGFVHQPESGYKTSRGHEGLFSSVLVRPQCCFLEGYLCCTQSADQFTPCGPSPLISVLHFRKFKCAFGRHSGSRLRQKSKRIKHGRVCLQCL